MSSADVQQRPLRLALFTYSTKPRGGVVHSLSLAEQVQALGHDVHLFALSKGQQGFFRPTAVPYTLIPHQVPDGVPLDERIGRYIETYYQFLVEHPSEAYDVYHAQDCISANALWRVRDEGRIPAFTRTIHHVEDFTSPSLIQCQDDSIYRPDHRIVVSRYWQDRLRRDFGLESHIMYNGVDLRRFRPPSEAQRRAARATLGVADQVAFLHIGGIEPRKNSIRLLKAFQSVHRDLAAQGLQAVLLLAGGETLLDYAAYRATFFEELDRSGLKLGTDVVLLGVVEDDQIPVLYHAADVLVFPSVKEGWGLVVLEAMASGLAVLASDLPVFREYLRDGENALLVHPEREADIAHGMNRLAQDKALRRTLAAAGPATASAFGWEKTARAHLTFYEQRLARRNSVPHGR